MEIDVRELCQALGVDYDPAKSVAFYLMLVKQYRLYYEAAQQSVQRTNRCTCGNPMSENAVMCAECVSEKKDALSR